MSLYRTLVLGITIMLTMSVSSYGDELQAGQRIKVKIDTIKTESILLFIKYDVKESRSITGELVSITNDTIIIIDDAWKGEVRHLLKSGIKQLYVADGTKRATWEGAALGASIGFLLGLVSYLGDHYPDSSGQPNRRYSDDQMAIRIFGFSTAAGALLGYLIRVDRWKELDRKSRNIGLAIDPNDNNLRFQLSFAF